MDGILGPLNSRSTWVPDQLWASARRYLQDRNVGPDRVGHGGDGPELIVPNEVLRDFGGGGASPRIVIATLRDRHATCSNWLSRFRVSSIPNQTMSSSSIVTSQHPETNTFSRLHRDRLSSDLENVVAYCGHQHLFPKVVNHWPSESPRNSAHLIPRRPIYRSTYPDVTKRGCQLWYAHIRKFRKPRGTPEGIRPGTS